MYFVYKALNKINGKFYVGITNDIKRRIKEHRTSPYPFGIALRKYGLKEFTIQTVEVNSVEEALELEQLAIGVEEVKDKNCYNICLGGAPSVVMFGQNPMHDPEVVRNHPSLFSPTNNPMHNPVSKKKMIQSQKCKKVTIRETLYYGVREAARDLGISRQCLVHRLKSSNFPEYNYS